MKEPSIDEQIEELREAGWRPVRVTVWRAPWGSYFVGPAGAWRSKRAHDEQVLIGQRRRGDKSAPCNPYRGPQR